MVDNQTQESPVALRIRDGIAILTLTNPERMNPLDDTVLSELFDLVRRVNADSEVRVVILTAEGPHFSVGADLNWEHEFSAESVPTTLRLQEHLSYEIRNAPKPYVAAVRGWCLGGANELQMHMDLCVASETAVFGQPEVRWGVLPFWHAPQFLPLMIGERRAREMLLLGDRYSADDALAMGLCNYVVPDDELERKSMALAEKLKERSATSMRILKTALNAPADLMQSAHNHQAALVSLLVETESYKKDMAKFFDRKRTRTSTETTGRTVGNEEEQRP